ncbi:MAG: hypothetical protein IJP53_00605 [Synergistaceae bacterium]|nr:hypothetical protein [Synergistaceae bacterium]MBR0093673.1 hypothetical protein [Synergistaceae bacterium]
MNKSIGMDWEELQNEIFTPDEIEASKMRIAPIVSEIRFKASHDFFRDMALSAARVAVM